MAWFIGILTFICTFMAIVFMGLFILSCISGVINPQVSMVNGQLRDKNESSRYMFLLITAIAWGIVIALP
jgi:dipeptide/tripeptide permease